VYKEIRATIQYGSQYRLISPQQNAYSAVEYVSQDGAEGVLFVFRTHLAEPAVLPLIHLRGLEAEGRYQIEGLEGVRSGRAWMKSGISIPLKDYQSAVRRIARI